LYRQGRHLLSVAWIVSLTAIRTYYITVVRTGPLLARSQRKVVPVCPLAACRLSVRPRVTVRKTPGRILLDFGVGVFYQNLAVLVKIGQQ
jgi:hypothetical protein